MMNLLGFVLTGDFVLLTGDFFFVGLLIENFLKMSVIIGGRYGSNFRSQPMDKTPLQGSEMLCRFSAKCSADSKEYRKDASPVMVSKPGNFTIMEM